jgi:hypothetical protein
MAGLGRLAEVFVLGDCADISKLLDGRGHGRQILIDKTD